LREIGGFSHKLTEERNEKLYTIFAAAVFFIASGLSRTPHAGGQGPRAKLGLGIN
jgi:hypothetical protein